MSNNEMTDRQRNVVGRFTRFKFKPVENKTITEQEQSDVWEDYFNALTEYGTFNRAAEVCNYAPQEVITYRKQNPWFNELCQIAIGRNKERIKAEALRRAVEGSPRYALGGKYRDTPIEIATEYSDRLLELYLKRDDPTFRETQQIEINADINTAELFEYNMYSSKTKRLLRQTLESIKEDKARREKETHVQ